MLVDDRSSFGADGEARGRTGDHYLGAVWFSGFGGGNRFASDAVSGRFMFELAEEMGSFGVAGGVGEIGGEWLFGRGAFGLHNGVTFRFEL